MKRHYDDEKYEFIQNDIFNSIIGIINNGKLCNDDKILQLKLLTSNNTDWFSTMNSDIMKLILTYLKERTLVVLYFTSRYCRRNVENMENFRKDSIKYFLQNILEYLRMQSAVYRRQGAKDKTNNINNLITWGFVENKFPIYYGHKVKDVDSKNIFTHLVENLLLFATEKGNIDIIKQVKKQHGNLFHYNNELAYTATIFNQYDVLKYLAYIDYPFEYNNSSIYRGTLCEKAVENGRMDILEILLSQKCKCLPKSVNIAAEKGFFDILKYLVEKVKVRIDQFTCASAAKGGHLDIVKYLREEHKCKWDKLTIDNASENHYIELVLWLKKTGCPKTYIRPVYGFTIIK